MRKDSRSLCISCSCLVVISESWLDCLVRVSIVGVQARLSCWNLARRAESWVECWRESSACFVVCFCVRVFCCVSCAGVMEGRSGPGGPVEVGTVGGGGLAAGGAGAGAAGAGAGAVVSPL